MIYILALIWAFIIFKSKISRLAIIFIPLILSFLTLILISLNHLRYVQDLQALAFIMLTTAVIKLWQE